MFKFPLKKGLALSVALIAFAAANFEPGVAAPFRAGYVALSDAAGNIDPSPTTPTGTLAASDPVEAVWSAPTEPLVDVPVELDGTKSTGEGPLSCTWSFENATGSVVYDLEEGCAIEFTFESPGTKYVRLAVTDANGDSASNRKSFLVAAAPDTTPPDTTIGSGPSGTTTSTSRQLLLLLDRARLELRMQARLRLLCRLQLAEGLLGPEHRRPHLLGPGHRCRRQRRPHSGDPQLDRRSGPGAAHHPGGSDLDRAHQPAGRRPGGTRRHQVNRRRAAQLHLDLRG